MPFAGGAGSVEANLKRWQKLFKDEDGNPPKIESKKVQGKNVEVTRAETSGHYYPRLVRRHRKSRTGPAPGFWASSSRAKKTSYYIRMVGPDKTMKKLTDDFDEMVKTIKLEEK